MKKYITLIILSIFTISSCEKDDICIEDTTPKLILKFYNNDIPTELKLVNSLSVWANEKAKLYENQKLDSIAIPLDLSQNSTQFEFSSGTLIDTINFTYDRKDIFVSRSCGYKTTFENLKIASITSNWIKNDTINNSTIENETAVHISIFH